MVKHEACAGRQNKGETKTVWSPRISIIFGCNNKVPTKHQPSTNLTRHDKKKQSTEDDVLYQRHYIGSCPEGLAHDLPQRDSDWSQSCVNSCSTELVMARRHIAGNIPFEEVCEQARNDHFVGKDPTLACCLQSIASARESETGCEAEACDARRQCILIYANVHVNNTSFVYIYR